MANLGNTSRKYKCFTVWLDIPTNECPPNHYRLLGLPPFESDAARILAAANQALAKVAAYDRPEDARDAAALRSYITKVASGLLNPHEKVAYDSELRQRPPTTSAPPVEQISQSHPIPAPHRDLNREGYYSGTGSEISHASTSVASLDDTVTVRPSMSQHSVESVAAAESVVPTASALAPTGSTAKTTKGARIWPWIAGIAAMNAVVLGGLVVWLLIRSTPIAPPPIEPPNSSPGGTTVATNAPAEPKVVNGARVGLDNTAAPPHREPPPDRSADSAAVEPLVRADSTSNAANPAAPNAAQTNGDEAKKKQEMTPPKDPLSGLLTELELPEVPSILGESSESVSAGSLHPSVVKDLTMHLDSEAAELESVLTFRLQQQGAEPGKLTRIWRIIAASSDVDEAALAAATFSGIAIGHFLIDSDSNLRFQWQLDDNFSQADQLRNSVLVLQHGAHRKEIALRQVIHAKRAVFDFERNVFRVPIEVSDLPKHQLLAVTFNELNGLEGVDLSTGETDLTFETPVEVALGKDRRLRLFSELEMDEPGRRMELVIRPKYLRDARGKASRSLTVKSFNEDVAALVRAINRGLGDFQGGLQDLPRLRAEMEQLRAVLNNLDPRDVAQQRQFGDVQRLATTGTTGD